jgi:hypothetical protein
MIKRLRHWWKNFEYWRWPPKKKINPAYTHEETANPIKVECMCSSCVQKIEPLVRKALQGLHSVEIDEVYDGDDRVSVMVSIKIPPSFDHPKYDRYTHEFEKSMGMLMEKCLVLSEKFKRNDVSISAFTIEATLYLGGEAADVIFEAGRPDWLTECLKTGKTEEELLNEALNDVGSEPEV